MTHFRKPHAVSMVAVAAIMFAGNPAIATSIQSPSGYQVMVPNGWKINQKGLGGSDLVACAPPVNGYADNVVVIVQTLPPGFALKDAQNQTHQDFPQVFTAFKLITEGFATVDGVQTYHMTATYQSRPAVRHLRVRELVAIKNGKAYIFTCTQADDGRNPNDQSFTTLLASVKWAK